LRSPRLFDLVEIDASAGNLEKYRAGVNLAAAGPI